VALPAAHASAGDATRNRGSVTSVTPTFRRQWHVYITDERSTAMKRLLILTALGLFLAAHGAATAMSFAPLPAAAAYGGSN
jgi:hypothetical protein